MGVAVAVEGQAQVVGGEREAARADVDVVPLDHVMGDRAGVVRPGHGVHRDRHRDLPPGPDQGCGGPHVVRGEVVERAARVVSTPAAPVLDRLEDLLELGQGDRRGPGQSGHGITHRLSAEGCLPERNLLEPYLPEPYLLEPRLPEPDPVEGPEAAGTPGPRTRPGRPSPTARQSPGRTGASRRARATAAR